jgi:hypothetical protein
MKPLLMPLQQLAHDSTALGSDHLRRAARVDHPDKRPAQFHKNPPHRMKRLQFLKLVGNAPSPHDPLK